MFVDPYNVLLAIAINEHERFKTVLCSRVTFLKALNRKQIDTFASFFSQGRSQTVLRFAKVSMKRPSISVVSPLVSDGSQLKIRHFSENQSNSSSDKFQAT